MEQFPYNSPPWRLAHKAVSPNGLVVAEIAEAREHSMSNPTVGILQTSDGLELPKCSPAFLWSDDSRWLAVPQWRHRFGLFQRQRLVIVAREERAVYVSRFTYWLMQPTSFVDGVLEMQVSGPSGISGDFWKREPFILDVPRVLSTSFRLNVRYGTP